MNRFVPVLPAAELAEGQGRSIEVEGRRIAIFHLGGEFFALDGRCPHRGGPVGEGWIEGGRVYCPLHGWSFDISTGACLDHRWKRLAKFATRVSNGMVEVELPS